MKQNLKRSLSIPWLPLNRAWAAASGLHRSAIIYYHSVADPPGPDQVPPPAFADQMAWLAAHHNVKPLSMILGGEPGVAIVFDDAYRSVLTNADPVLSAYRLPYTVAVPTGSVGQLAGWKTGLDPVTSAVMSWEDLASLSPTTTFASHTVTHRPLWLLEDLEQVAELSDSREDIRIRFGRRALDVVVWPHGRADARAIAAAQHLGYRRCLAGGWETCHRLESPEWRRTLIDHNDSLFDLRLKIAGGWDWLDLVRRLREYST